MSAPEPDYERLEPGAETALAGAQDVLLSYLRRVHRFEIGGHLDAPDEQMLIVANHGFGGIFDLNAAAVMVAGRVLGVRRPTTVLVHQIAWTLQVGRLLEPFGARPASRQAALDAFARGHNVLVLPGGDRDAFKAHRDRHKILFNGHAGFARLAMEADVPILPVVTAGAGDTLYVLTDGQGLARALRVDKLLRLNALPVSISVPWGLNVGLVGLLPYLPLPTHLRTRVLETMRPGPDETATDYAHRVSQTMQMALDDLGAR